LDADTFSEAVLPQLDIFSVPPTQCSIEKVRFQDFRPISQLTNGSPIDFLVDNGGLEYTDLSRSRLYIKARIVKEDGTPLKTTDIVGPVNNLLDSIFSQCNCTLGDKLVSVSASIYAYKAYLKNLLEFGREAKEGQLAASLWATDRGTDIDSVAPAETG
jgi:hypothetical protein